MSLLSALIQKRETRKAATAIPAISATQPNEGAATVARIATVAVASPTESKTANAATSHRWLVHFADREPLEIFTHPDASFDRVMREYPDALAAEPIPEREPEPTTCTSCTHSRKPGGVTRHCAARPELPPAYGDGHPLRQLPDDMGATCNTYEMKGWDA